MRIIIFNLTANSNEQDVADSINKFNKKKDYNSFINLLTSSLSWMMSRVNVDKIRFEIKNLNGIACYDNNTICIDAKALKHYKKGIVLANALKSIFHELAHNLIEKKNELYYYGKSDIYLEKFSFAKVHELLVEIMGEQDFLFEIEYKYYKQNENEQCANNLQNKMFNIFNNNFIIFNDEQLKKFANENQHRKFPYLKSIEEYEQIFSKMLLKWQKAFIDNASSLSDYTQFNFSLSLQHSQIITNYIKKIIIETDNSEVINKLLLCPKVTITKSELDILNSKFKNNEIHIPLQKGKVKENEMEM